MQNPLSSISDVLDVKGKNSATHKVPPDTTVFDAVGMMNQHKIGSLVVERDGRVVGIFTERDVLVRLVGADLDPHTTPVAEVMTRDPLCISKSMLATDVMAVATNKRCRHFPVVEDDQLIGLVSIGDLVHLETRDQQSRIDAGIRAIKAVAGR